jgi:Fanconi anaemia protein FancD2 nuclease
VDVEPSLKLLLSRVKDGSITCGMLNQCVKENPEAVLLPRVWSASMHVAHMFVSQRASVRARAASGGSAHVQTHDVHRFGQEMYVSCFEKLAESGTHHAAILQDIIARVLQHVLTHSTSEVDCALDVLIELAERRGPQAASSAATFSVLIKEIVHPSNLRHLSDEQTRKAFRVLAALSMLNPDVGNDDENLVIYVQKMLMDTEEAVQRMGIIGGVAMLRVTDLSDPEAPLVSDDQVHTALQPLLSFLEKTSEKQQWSRATGGRPQLNRKALADKRRRKGTPSVSANPLRPQQGSVRAHKSALVGRYVHIFCLFFHANQATDFGM